MKEISHLLTEPFFEFAVILLLAAVFGSIGQLLRQPLIVMFIALGIIVGPSVLDIVHSKQQIHLLAEIGIAILLFIVGLKLDLRLIKSTGKIALYTGMGQVIFTSVIGYLIALLLGFSHVHSFYIAVALTFSSTIIIVKLLSDKKEIDALHGQIAIGFLIVQDIVVILIMIVLSTMGKNDDAGLLRNITGTLIMITVMVSITYASMRWLLPPLTRYLAKSQELLTLFAIAWAVALAAGSEAGGFSAEVGAFLAGVSLASSPFKDAISGRLVSLRDFLLLFFFVNLGAALDLSVIGRQIPAALIFSLFVLVGNPLIVLVIMGVMGYKKRTSFLAGLTVAQISEFSLIFAGLGLTVGHLNEEIVGLITLVGLITIGLSTYMILYSHQIYNWISPALSIFEKPNPFREAKMHKFSKGNYDIIIIGLGRIGTKIVENLGKHREIKLLGIDFDPQVVAKWQRENKPVFYGDIEDPDLLEQIQFSSSRCIVYTIPETRFAVPLAQMLKRNNYEGKVYVLVTHENDIVKLADAPVDAILLPHKMAADNFYNVYIKAVLKEE